MPFDDSKKFKDRLRLIMFVDVFGIALLKNHQVVLPSHLVEKFMPWLFYLDINPPHIEI